MAEQNRGRASKVLRGIVVTLMGLTVAFTLLGGAGTACVAFGAEKYDSNDAGRDGTAASFLAPIPWAWQAAPRAAYFVQTGMTGKLREPVQAPM